MKILVNLKLRSLDEKNFAIIRSKGDHALFGHSTKDMKQKRKIKQNQPLADFMPTILLKAKDFATEITPEHLPPAEDIKKIERKITTDDKKSLNSSNNV